MPALPLKCLSCLDFLWKLVSSLTWYHVIKIDPLLFAQPLSDLTYTEAGDVVALHLASSNCCHACKRGRRLCRDWASWKGNAGIYCRECPCSLSILWKVSCSGSPLHQKLQFLKIISYFRLLRNYNHLRWYLTPSPLTSWAGCLSTHPAFLNKGAMRWCQYNWEVVSSKKTSHQIIRNAKKKSSRILG